MFEQVLQNDIIGLIRNLGDMGVFIAMALESSIVPLPSELVVLGAGAIGISLFSIVVFGALGSTLGGACGYLIGKYAAKPVILKFGKYVFVKEHHIDKAEAFARKYGVSSVLIGRIIPVVPFKVFSISAGITRIPFIPFIICTLIGVLPRIYLLAVFGASIIKYTKPAVLVLGLAVAVFLVFKIRNNISERKNKEEK